MFCASRFAISFWEHLANSIKGALIFAAIAVVVYYFLVPATVTLLIVSGISIYLRKGAFSALVVAGIPLAIVLDDFFIEGNRTEFRAYAFSFYAVLLTVNALRQSRLLKENKHER